MPTMSDNFGLYDLDSSLSEAPAKTFPSPASVVEFMESDQVFSSDAWSYVLRAKPLGFSGKTCLEFSAAEAAETLPQSLKRLQGSALRFRRAAGAIPASVSARSTLRPGLCWTRNGSEFRKDAAACSLSEVLEGEAVPTKYYLSPQACRGILRRAAKRGKDLPQKLRLALTAVADSEQISTVTEDS